MCIVHYELQKEKENREERKTICYEQNQIYNSLSDLEKYITPTTSAA